MIMHFDVWCVNEWVWILSTSVRQTLISVIISYQCECVFATISLWSPLLLFNDTFLVNFAVVWTSQRANPTLINRKKRKKRERCTLSWGWSAGKDHRRGALLFGGTHASRPHRAKKRKQVKTLRKWKEKRMVVVVMEKAATDPKSQWSEIPFLSYLSTFSLSLSLSLFVRPSLGAVYHWIAVESIVLRLLSLFSLSLSLFLSFISDVKLHQRDDSDQWTAADNCVDQDCRLTKGLTLARRIHPRGPFLFLVSALFTLFLSLLLLFFLRSLSTFLRGGRYQIQFTIILSVCLSVSHLQCCWLSGTAVAV